MREKRSNINRMVNRTAIHYILVTLLEKGTSQNCKERKKDTSWAWEKHTEGTRESVSGEIKKLISNQVETKKAINEMQSRMEVLTTRINEALERISDIEDKMMENKESEKKGGKQQMDHEGRIRDISDSIYSEIILK